MEDENTTSLCFELVLFKTYISGKQLAKLTLRQTYCICTHSRTAGKKKIMGDFRPLPACK